MVASLVPAAEFSSSTSKIMLVSQLARYHSTLPRAGSGPVSK